MTNHGSGQLHRLRQENGHTVHSGSHTRSAAGHSCTKIAEATDERRWHIKPPLPSV